MKKIIFLSSILFFVLVNSCGILEQTREYERFVNSNFQLVDFKVTEISGVNMNGVNKMSDLNMGDVLTLTGRMFSGNGLTTKMKAFIEVENTHSQKASFSGLDWKFLIKGIEYTTGTINTGVEVPAYSKKIFTVNADLDLLKVLQSESLSQVMDVVFNMNDDQAIKQLGLELKLKPHFKTATGIVKYPGYFTITP